MARLGHPARHLDRIDSTMTEAARWAEAGAPHGALVTAHHQTAGRGRHGRTWQAAPGDSLLCTLVLRPALAPSRLGLVALAAGLAAAEAVDGLGVAARIKWPNDVRVRGRKLAGVLAEARHPSSGPVVLLGLGLNVRQSAFPDGLAATSLRLETGRDLPPHSLLDPFLEALAVHLAGLDADPGRVIRSLESRLDLVGEAVTVRDPATGAGVARGTVCGLAGDGGLRLATPAGDQTVYAGEVTLSP